MNMRIALHRINRESPVARAALFTATAALVLTCGEKATAAPPRPYEPRQAGSLEIYDSPVTGLATFVTAIDGGPIPFDRAGIRAADAEPIAFFEEYGRLFGVTDARRQLVTVRTIEDEIGQTHTKFEQVHRGVAVFSGVLTVHRNGAGDFVAANGDFYPIRDDFNTVPTLGPGRAAMMAAQRINVGDPVVEQSKLVIVDPGWYGDPPAGEHLAYYIIFTDPAAPYREAFFVDAHTGKVLDRWNLLHTDRFREIWDGLSQSTLPGIGVPARIEGEARYLDSSDSQRNKDVNWLYDYSRDTYDFFARAFGRDGIDGAGSKMVATAGIGNIPNTPCPNAFWNGAQIAFCPGTVTDDVVGHEWGHGVTQFSAGLIYQNQSGQLNESYSDVWGELIDLFNGGAALPGPPDDTPPWPKDQFYIDAGTDEPNNLRTGCTGSAYVDGYRWAMAEDAVAFNLGPIRDMWQPNCLGDPDYANAPEQFCQGDNGGVHSGSGVPNHAFAMLSDGKTYRDWVVNPIGPIKAAAVWYRALTVYLTPASDFRDAFVALTQAADDLVGQQPKDPRTGNFWAAITASDAVQVDHALRAVEMNTEGACGARQPVLDDTPPDQCSPRFSVFFDDFESGPNGWTVENVGRNGLPPPTPYDWVQRQELPADREGTAWYCKDLFEGVCNDPVGDESALHSLISPPIQMPPRFERPRLAFTHFVYTETSYDGGIVSIKVNGGEWRKLDGFYFTHNRYNLTLDANNANPLAGQQAFTGAGRVWGTSVVDLSTYVSLGDTIQFRFDFGKDGCNGLDGWYVDDFDVYVCTCASDEECDDGVFCTGPESCTDGVCVSAGNPCGEAFCSEERQSCPPTLLWETFENGTPDGWLFFGQPYSVDYALSGDWIVGDPVGTLSAGLPSQPEDAYDGTQCAFTAQNPDAVPGVQDVDNGLVQMITRAVDLSGVDSADLTYARWFFQHDLGDDSTDYFAVDVTNNPDDPVWVNLETLGPETRENHWAVVSFALEDYIEFTDAVHVRFTASDGIKDRQEILEAAVDNVAISTTAPCTADKECQDDDLCTLDVCDNGTCVNTAASCPTIVTSDPPSGVIDARAPSDPSGSVTDGWQSFDVTFDRPVFGLQAGDFTVQHRTRDGTLGSGPAIVDVSPVDSDTVRVTLDSRIAPAYWTMITLGVSGSAICYGYLPGDVDQNGTTSAADIGALIDCINGATTCEAWACDIDRVAPCSAADIGRLVDLLNGAGTYESWLLAELGPSPCAP